MATFDQRGQTVQYQYNADTINFGAVQTPDDFRQQLRNLQAELKRAIEARAIPDEKAVDAEAQVKKAIIQAEKPAPDKKTLIQHLTSAKELVSGVTGLAGALAGAIAAVGALF
jgi:hypothetical protein